MSHILGRWVIGFILGLSANALAEEIPLTGKTFTHQIGTDAECAKWTLADPIFNCYQKLEFIEGHKVLVRMTDIVNIEDYKLIGNTLTVRVEEFGREFEFQLDRNQKTMVESGGAIYILEHGLTCK